MTKQEQIEYFKKKIRENNEKVNALWERRKNGEFPPDNIEKWKEFENLMMETDKSIEIDQELVDAGLYEYFLENNLY